MCMKTCLFRGSAEPRTSGSEDMSTRVIAEKSPARVEVSRDWKNLQACTRELRGDKELVMVAVKLNGKALMYA